MRRDFIYFTFLYFLTITSFSQTVDQKIQLINFAKEKDQEWKEKRLEAELLAVKSGIPIEVIDPHGSCSELQRFENGMPVYYITHNLNAAKTISTNKVWPDGGYG